MQNWYLSLIFVPLYVGTFLIWQFFPSRAAFIGVSFATAAIMSFCFILALRRGYFVNRSDAVVHGLVIVDVVAEGLAWEFLLLFGMVEPEGVLAFHDNQTFWGCTAFFILIIGGHRWLMLRKSQSS